MSPEVQAFLAAGGRIRKFAMGESSEPEFIIGWMQAEGAPVRYIGRGFCRIGKRTMGLAGLIDAANKMRVARGLEPFCLHPSKATRFFSFGTPKTYKGKAA